MVVALFASSVVPVLAGLITIYLLCLGHAARQVHRGSSAQLVQRIALAARNCFVDESWLSIY